jgi:galactonate dehydratase
MNITALTTYIVPPRWILLRVETDEGVTGWGTEALKEAEAWVGSPASASA